MSDHVCDGTSVFFDLTKAFDKVWREGLLLKILESLEKCTDGSDASYRTDRPE